MPYSLRLFLLLPLLLSAATCFAAPAPSQIQVPPGWTVELAAESALVAHPMMAGFDERGRLFVAASAGKNLPWNELMEQRPNSIRLLEDTDGDGHFDKSSVFADQLTFPMGALWHQGALYVASPPSIWRLEDADGDGIAEKREEIVTGFGSIGNAADVHGCFLGPSGRIYWCDGRHGHEIRDGNHRLVSQGKAARIFSCRPDGSDVRTHCGGGMDNPVEIDFWPTGEMLGVVNYFYPKRGDCLVHWVYGGCYPRGDLTDVLAEFKRTGSLLPPIHDLGHVAPSGTMRYCSDALGDEFRDNVFIAQFDTHQVQRARLHREGASFGAKVSDFLKSDNADFHPTDVLEDADGSLLVVDTGGWFSIGCPTSRLAKPDIQGAIYRVRRCDAPKVDDARGQNLPWASSPPEQLAHWLDDPRFAVRQRAIAELARRKNLAIPVLSSATPSLSPTGRRHALEALARIDAADARAAIRGRLADEDDSVRQLAVNLAGELRDAEAVDALITLLASAAPSIRREAATALGQVKQARAVPALLAAASGQTDRILEHALIFALIEIDDREATLPGLSAKEASTRRAALIALDQMESGRLTRELVTPLVGAEDAALQQAALEIVGRHADWADEVIQAAQRWLLQPAFTAEQESLLSATLLAFQQNPQIQRLIAEAIDNQKTPIPSRLLLLSVMEQCDLQPIPKAWAKPLARILAAGDNDLAARAVATVAANGGSAFDDLLCGLANDANRPQELRAAALCVAASHGRKLTGAEFDLLAGQISPERSPLQRLAAARALSGAHLNTTQLDRIVGLIQSAGPLELPTLLSAFENSTGEPPAKKVLAALEKSPGLAAITPAQLETALARYPAEARGDANPLLARLRVGRQEQEAHLQQLEGQLRGGDPRRGRDAFFSTQLSCSACHRVGSEGGHIGPDLSGVGSRRTARDLLESIAYPSSTLARGFESYTAATDSGQSYTGIIVRETASMVYLRTARDAELRIPRRSIESIQPSAISIMPSGLDKLMTVEQLRDLVAYLTSLKS